LPKAILVIFAFITVTGEQLAARQLELKLLGCGLGERSLHKGVQWLKLGQTTFALKDKLGTAMTLIVLQLKILWLKLGTCDAARFFCNRSCFP